jgi:two-component system sensor histidine kinase ChvG
LGLRTQLLLVSLTTLLLPWAGCHYVQEMENALRENQSQALQQQAAILAQLLQTTPLPTPSNEAVFYTPRRYQPVQVDGYGDDWQSHALEVLHSHLNTAPKVTLQKALYQDRLYLFMQIASKQIHYHNPGQAFTHSDHLRLRSYSANQQKQWVLFTSGPGQLQVFEWLPQHNSLRPAPGIEVWWQETHNGFNVEISLPQKDLLPRLTLDLYQMADNEKPAQKILSTVQPDKGRGNLWLKPDDSLSELLQQQRSTQQDAVFINPQGWPLSPQRDWISQPEPIEPATNPNNLFKQGISRFYRLMIDILTPQASQAPWPLENLELSTRQTRFDLQALQNPATATQSGAHAAWYQLQGHQHSALLVLQPVYQHQQLTGYLLLSQTGDALISLTNQALRRVTHLTLSTMVLVIVVLVAFASSLSWRVHRLKQNAEHAISHDGKIQPFHASRRQDEIGDLSRSYQNLLQRIHGYTDYLETLNGKLAHELRTPLAIVKSSLELARSQIGDAAGSETYLQRAEQGIERLRLILSAMSEASRVEQTIQQSDRQAFDLADLLRTLGQAYADTYPTHQFETQCSVQHAIINGSPELMAQLLDKLVDNARSFAPPTTIITLALQQQPGGYTLLVRNLGSSLPQQLQHQLFDSLVSERDTANNSSDNCEAPHLGLGLYIVRLIATAHGGSVQAQNLPQNNGVEFSITLPS